jgi:uncharacterized protein
MMFQHLFLMMGIACNFNCRYCMQHPLLTKPVCGPRLSPQVIDFLLNLPPFDESNPENRYNMTCYGGEPLLYWDLVKQVVELLEPTGKFNIGMVSNGSLLTDEKVDYMSEHKMGYTLSNDGPRTAELRGRNVLEEPEIVRLLNRIPHWTIESVLTARNYNLPENLAYWKSKGIDSDHIQLDLVQDTGGLPSDLTTFDLGGFQKIMDGVEERLYQSLINNTPTPEMGIANGYIWRMRAAINNEEVLNQPKCGVGYGQLNFDLEGNCYLCHNCSTRIGTVKDSEQVLIEAYKKYDPFTTGPECQACSVLATCGGGCLLVSAEQRKNYFCPMARIYYGAVQNAVIRAGKTLAERKQAQGA